MIDVMAVYRKIEELKNKGAGDVPVCIQTLCSEINAGADLVAEYLKALEILEFIRFEGKEYVVPVR